MTTSPKGEKKPRQKTTLHLVSITMADGSDINGPEAQLRIARALWSLVQMPKQAVGHAAD
ncbi:hypothetical protein [Deinococcus altitudinis]|uniref:hypothetical protein n=1 Tax=Deinococcus altitudinis TaxID=468914 RepID=UPI0038915489